MAGHFCKSRYVYFITYMCINYLSRQLVNENNIIMYITDYETTKNNKLQQNIYVCIQG